MGDALGRLWEDLKVLQAGAEMIDRFHIGRTRDGPLPCPLPVDNGLFTQACLRVVMSQQFGLRLAELGKARLHHLGNALMVLLAGAPQQGLIGRVPDQGVLETVGRLGWQSLLVEKLCLHQLVQTLSQGPLVPGRDGL
jgi:hypothetical protein